MDDWQKNAKYILKAIERIEKAIEDHRKEFHEFKITSVIDTTALKAKSRTWGAIAGVVVSLVIAVASKFI